MEFIKIKKMTDEEKEKIRELTMQGVPTDDVAALMHYSPSTILYHRNKMGLYKPKDYCDAQH